MLGTVVLTNVSLRRSVRSDQHSSIRCPTNKYLSLLTDQREPRSYEEGIELEHKREGIYLMKDEMDLLHENYTFKLMKLLKEKIALKNI